MYMQAHMYVHVCTCMHLNWNNYFLFPRFALRHRNEDPAPFRGPVDVFLVFFVLLSGNILPDIADSKKYYMNWFQLIKQ
jgi:hypothetical protein